jgi:hypothetical protein
MPHSYMPVSASWGTIRTPMDPSSRTLPHIAIATIGGLERISTSSTSATATPTTRRSYGSGTRRDYTTTSVNESATLSAPATDIYRYMMYIGVNFLDNLCIY